MLGYCIFPINISALLVITLRGFYGPMLKLLIVLGGFAWASYCKFSFIMCGFCSFLLGAIGYMGSIAKEDKK
jgi:hypothetical protein